MAATPPTTSENAMLAPDAKTDRILWIVIAVSVVACAAFVFFTPVEAMLGQYLKLVLFHGASIWVNVLSFTTAGALAVAYLVNRRPGTYAYVASARYVSFGLWLFNTALGMVSAWMTWGDSFIREPRLQASFWIILLLGMAMALDIMMDKPRLHAAFDIGIAVAIWLLVFVPAKDIHPNNPVFASGWQIKALFGGMVVTWAVAVFSLIRIWAERLARDGAGVEGMPDEVD
jgi:hypothetical protein